MDSSFPDLPSSIDLPAPPTQTHVPNSGSIAIAVVLPKPTISMRLPSSKRKKGKFSVKKQQALEKKFQILVEKLSLIPFTPSKTLDFSKHETLLRNLGLWDFVCVDFDKSIRLDLIAQLVAAYDSKLRCSYVNGVKIMVNRADLGRAFKLRVMKEKSGVYFIDDMELDSKDSLNFIEDFVNYWVLLHDDIWMMPSEVLNWMKLIREGHPEKVDWAGMLWFMIEKELTQGEHLQDCYYASHLQYLIKSQHEEVLFKDEPEIVDLDADEEEEEEEVEENDSFKVANESPVKESIEIKGISIELTLSPDMMNIDEETGLWKMEQCTNVYQETVKEDGFGNTFQSEGLTGNLLESMETSYTIPEEDVGPSFYNNGKREINHEESMFIKRSRINDQWDNNNHKSSDIATYMEQMNEVITKASMTYKEQEHKIQELNMTQQMYHNQLQIRDHVIQQKCEEIATKSEMILRLERELLVMSNIMEGYRKASKETDKEFAEYRKRQSFRVPEEPIYKDVGPGGLMLSDAQLERLTLKQEEDFKRNFLFIVPKAQKAEQEWINQFKSVVYEKLRVLHERLVGLENEMKKIRALREERKIRECPQEEISDY